MAKKANKKNAIELTADQKTVLENVTTELLTVRDAFIEAVYKATLTLKEVLVEKIEVMEKAKIPSPVIYKTIQDITKPLVKNGNTSQQNISKILTSRGHKMKTTRKDAGITKTLNKVSVGYIKIAEATTKAVLVNKKKADKEKKPVTAEQIAKLFKAASTDEQAKAVDLINEIVTELDKS
tara:strand:+ start:1218 stop:1757 length:540 start_codon:yes stop_codon:yes gene_type:complete